MSLHETALMGFGRGAPAYERGRPGYPEEAVDWMTERLQIGAASTVVDLGAGTGKFTRLLLACGARVYAVEPSAGMREELHRVVPKATLLDATAHEIPLPDGSVDAVTAAQSFHWFATERVLHELRRLLRPAGGLGLIWNRPDRDHPLQQALEEIIARHRSAPAAYETGGWTDTMRLTRLFTPMGQQQFNYEQKLDREGLIARVLSISFVATLPEEGRDAVAREVESAAGPGNEFRLPYRTDAYLFRRSDA